MPVGGTLPAVRPPSKPVRGTSIKYCTVYIYRLQSLSFKACRWHPVCCPPTLKAFQRHLNSIQYSIYIYTSSCSPSLNTCRWPSAGCPPTLKAFQSHLIYCTVLYIYTSSCSPSLKEGLSVAHCLLSVHPQSLSEAPIVLFAKPQGLSVEQLESVFAQTDTSDRASVISDGKWLEKSLRSTNQQE